MIHTQILEQRPFSLADGDRYLLVIHRDGKNQVYTRKYQNKPVMSPEFKEAKTFQTQKALEQTIKTVLAPNGYNFTVFQVKDLFEPRYFIAFKDNVVQAPYIRNYQSWYIKGENPVNTYLDRIQAQDVLDKYKVELLQYHHSKIMELKYITL
jgi:hypothetical protein